MNAILAIECILNKSRYASKFYAILLKFLNCDLFNKLWNV